MVATTALLVVALAIAAVVAVTPRFDDVPPDADVVVALGGSPGRVDLAHEIVEDTGATLVLSSESIDVGEHAGLRCGVDAICLEPEPHNTAGEARGMAALAQEHGWRQVVVATSSFHVNRSRMLFRQCLDEVAVVGTARDPWTEEPVLRFTRELAGMIAGSTVARAC